MVLYAQTKDPGKTSVRQDRVPPDIELKDWTEEQSVYLEETYLEGNANDNNRVDALVVNDGSILRRPGKKVYFNKIVRLKEGNNPFHFQAQDNSGNIGTKSINIQRHVQEIRKVGSRMDLVVLPFERKGESSGVERLLEESLRGVLVKSGRFNMKRKIAPESGNLDDPEAAARIGKKMDANYVLVGSVAEQAGALEIFAQIVETKTSQILTIQNVYGVDIDRERLNELCRGLVIKLHDALPVSEGIVVRVVGKKVYLDLGRERRIKEGMRCILFKEGEPLVHPITGKAIGSPVIELGHAIILAVHEGYSEAQIQKVLADGIAPSHKVITQ
jgi:TolB-like protein